MMFDPKSLELADHFLPTDTSQELRYELAQAIQTAAEDWLEAEADKIKKRGRGYPGAGRA